MSMTAHKLDVLRSVDGENKVLIKNLKPSAAQEAVFPNGGIYAGRCVSRNSTGDAELGVIGRRVGYMTFRDTSHPSVGGMSDPTSVADQVDLTYKDGVDKAVLAFACIDGVEFATTEFDAAQTYNINDLLVARHATQINGGSPTDAQLIAQGGVLTNVGAQHGKTPNVGVVSEVAFRNPHRVNMLVFYGWYDPPIEALPDGIDEPTWQA